MKHHNRIRLRLLALSTLAVLLLGACASGMAPMGAQPVPTDTFGVVEVNEGQPLRIAMVTASAPDGMAVIGEAQRIGIERAREDADLPNNLAVELLPITDECSAASGEEVAQSIVDEPTVVAVVGHTCSEACRAAAPIYAEANLTMVSPSCGAASLTEPMSHPESFARVMYDDRNEGTGAGSQAFVGLGARSAVIIGTGTTETNAFVEGFEAMFESSGGEILDELLLSEVTQEEAISAAVELAPDVVYLAVLPDDAATLAEAIRRGAPGTLFMGTRSLWTPWFIQALDPAAAQMFATGPYLQQSDAFIITSEVYWASAYAYDAASIVFAALAETAVTQGGTTSVGLGQMRSAIFNTTSHEGVTGLLTCTSRGDCSATNTALSQLMDNQWTVISVLD